MATKAELEAKEAQCKSVEDYCKLAMEALTEPKDEGYAKELVSNAEGDCSMPKDYIYVAEVYAKLGNKESAEEMYEEAEDACFEPMETAMLGHSIAVYLGDKEKAKELLESAANSAKKINEILAISNYVQSDLGDAELSKKLLSKVEGQLKSLKDYVDLAKTIIKETGDKETAKSFFQKASDKLDGIADAVEYANAVIELFADKEMAKSALEGVEDDAQFTKDYVALAKGYMSLGDSDRAKELLESGKEFAMTGEENIELADAYWTLFKDKEAAANGYGKGLNDINDKEKLLSFAKTIALEMDNTELAKKFYQRAESKMSGAKDLTTLAQAVVDVLKDKDYAKGIYERAVQSMDVPQELMMLAGDIIKNLGDKVSAKNVYEKALEKIGKFPAYLELFDAVVGNIQDKEFGKLILQKAEAMAGTTPELLQLATKAYDVLQDTEYSSELLVKAEEVVTNLNEMKDVNKTIKERFAGDGDWIKRVDEKLDKREKNQDKYDAYQKREEAAKTFKDLRLIVDDMMAELDDRYYAQKLLKAGLEKLNSQQFNVDNYRKLIQSIAKYLNDNNWIKTILDDLIANRTKFFFDFAGTCRIAIEETPDKELGKQLVEDYCKKYENKIDSNPNKTAYDYTNLAKAVNQLLKDGNWSVHLLEKAAQTDGDYLTFSYMSYLARLFNDEKTSNMYLEKAVQELDSAVQYQKLTERLKSLKFKTEEIKKLYANGSKLSSPKEKLIWAEGIVDLLNDRNWAEKVYKELGSGFKSDEEKEIFETSRKIRLEGKFC
jgi:Tfp pilus assembly protein PilF